MYAFRSRLATQRPSVALPIVNRSTPVVVQERRIWIEAVLVMMAWMSAACAPLTAPTHQPASVVVSKSPPPSVVPDAAIADAMVTRALYGLRADEAWARQVAVDPTAQAGIVEFGIPLTPAELADIRSRRWDENVLLSARGYCLSVPKDCAGTYNNLKGSGVVVDIAHDVERHRQVLSNMVSDPSLIYVRDVEWSLAELQDFIGVVEADQAWFDTIGVQYLQVDRSINDNFVHVDYWAPNDRASAAIEAHFGHPTWLVARWIGPPPWAGPRADLVLRITDSTGQPVTDIRCDLRPQNPMADNGFAEFIFTTDASGVCDIQDIPAVAYRVNLLRIHDDQLESDPIKELQVTLAPTGTDVDVIVPLG